MRKEEWEDGLEDFKAIMALGFWVILWIPQIIFWCIRNYWNHKKCDSENFWDYR